MMKNSNLISARYLTILLTMVAIIIQPACMRVQSQPGKAHEVEAADSKTIAPLSPEQEAAAAESIVLIVDNSDYVVITGADQLEQNQGLQLGRSRRNSQNNAMDSVNGRQEMANPDEPPGQADQNNQNANANSDQRQERVTEAKNRLDTKDYFQISSIRIKGFNDLKNKLLDLKAQGRLESVHIDFTKIGYRAGERLMAVLDDPVFGIKNLSIKFDSDDKYLAFPTQPQVLANLETLSINGELDIDWFKESVGSLQNIEALSVDAVSKADKVKFGNMLSYLPKLEILNIPLFFESLPDVALIPPAVLERLKFVGIREIAADIAEPITKLLREGDIASDQPKVQKKKSWIEKLKTLSKIKAGVGVVLGAMIGVVGGLILMMLSPVAAAFSSAIVLWALVIFASSAVGGAAVGGSIGFAITGVQEIRKTLESKKIARDFVDTLVLQIEDFRKRQKQSEDELREFIALIKKEPNNITASIKPVLAKSLNDEIAIKYKDQKEMADKLRKSINDSGPPMYLTGGISQTEPFKLAFQQHVNAVSDLSRSDSDADLEKLFFSALLAFDSATDTVYSDGSTKDFEPLFENRRLRLLFGLYQAMNIFEAADL